MTSRSAFCSLLFCVLFTVSSGCPLGSTDDDDSGDDDDATEPPADLDGDGVPADLDCDDADPNNFPGNTEVCDGADNDCDGVLFSGEVDADGDAYLVCAGDCDDTRATAYPGAIEICNGYDDDCDGVVPAVETDDDGDTFSECANNDCDDTDSTVHPGAQELCNGVDDDCDGVVSAAETTDADGDGFVVCNDCDDADLTPCVAPVVPCTGMFLGVLPIESCAALNWAVNLAFVEDATPLLDELEAEIALLGTGSCPAYSSATTSVSPNPCSHVPPYSQTLETWTGACTDAGIAVSGSLERNDEYEQCDVSSSSIDQITGTGFRVDWTGAGPSPGLDLFALTGVLAEDVGGTIDSTWGWGSDVDLDATVDVGGTFAGASLALAFPEGRTIVEQGRNSADLASGIGDCSDETSVGSMALTATARALTAPWVATGTGNWADNPCGGPNCMIEPLTGSVTVDVYDTAGGPIVRSASIVFDGATSCDGCSEVFDGGVLVGTVCSALWAN